MDCSAVVRLRVDNDTPVHEFQSFLHAVETDAASFHRLRGIKANARILDGQLDLIRSSR